MSNTLFDLSGKTAVITGSSRGIGKAIAVRLADYGAKVVVSSRKIDACNLVVDEINNSGGEAFACECNISSKEALQNLANFSKEKLGKIDILVLNAASNPYYGPLINIPDEAFEKIMSNNVKSNLWLANMVLPQMEKIGGGRIIVISSIAGITGSPVLGAYSISKTADLGLVRSLATEWGPKNITVNALCPGLIISLESINSLIRLDLSPFILSLIPIFLCSLVNVKGGFIYNEQFSTNFDISFQQSSKNNKFLSDRVVNIDFFGGINFSSILVSMKS